MESFYLRFRKSRFYIKKLEKNLRFSSMPKNSNLLKTRILSVIDCLKYCSWSQSIHKHKHPNNQNNWHFIHIMSQALSKSWPEKHKGNCVPDLKFISFNNGYIVNIRRMYCPSIMSLVAHRFGRVEFRIFVFFIFNCA